MEKIKSIWIIVDHPNQLATAIGLSSFINRQKYQINLLISNHPYWEKVPRELYQNTFDNIIIFERPDYSKYPHRILKNILLIFKIKREIKQLNFRKNDIIVGLSVFNYLENIVLSVHKKCIKIAMMPIGVYKECNDPLSDITCYQTIEGFIFSRLIEPFFSLHRTLYKRVRNHKEIAPRIRYQKLLTEIYDYIIVLESQKCPQSIDKVTYSMPFPYSGIKKKRILDVENKKKVIFFGVPFRNMEHGLSAEVYVPYLNQCLNFLRKFYSPEYTLIYRPHPAEVNEINLLNLEHFVVESDGLLSELYYIQNYSDIHAIFSVASTSSRSGFFFSLPSYVFCKIFPLNETIQRCISVDEMGDLPDSFYIKDLSLSPINYFENNADSSDYDQCYKVMKEIFNNIEKINGSSPDLG